MYYCVFIVYNKLHNIILHTDFTENVLRSENDFIPSYYIILNYTKMMGAPCYGQIYRIIPILYSSINNKYS